MVHLELCERESARPIGIGLDEHFREHLLELFFGEVAHASPPLLLLEEAVEVFESIGKVVLVLRLVPQEFACKVLENGGRTFWHRILLAIAGGGRHPRNAVKLRRVSESAAERTPATQLNKPVVLNPWNDRLSSKGLFNNN